MTELVSGTYFKDFPVRVYGTFENPWFIAVDVQAALGLKSGFAFQRDYIVDDEYVKIQIRSADNKTRDVNAFTEYGLINVLSRTRTETGIQFRKIVYSVFKELRLKGEVTWKTASERYRREAQFLRSKIDTKYITRVYIVQGPRRKHKTWYKIGQSNDITRRIKEIRTSSYYEPNLITILNGAQTDFEVHKFMLLNFSDVQHVREWFLLDIVQLNIVKKRFAHVNFLE
jgi:prophage antirepressor-like protein